MPAPAINVITKLKDLRRLGGVLGAHGLGKLRFSSPKAIVSALRKASPEVRKAVSNTVSDDLGRITAELERVSKLRAAVKGTDPAMYEALTQRAKTLSRYATNLEYSMPFFKQTGMDRAKRMAGLGFNAWWGGQSLYDAYNDAKEGNYSNAAFHLAMAPMFGLGSVANHAARGLSAAGKAPRLAKALSAFGMAERKMVAAGKYGTSGNAITRWMMRHPYLTSEGVGTAIGAPTMLSAFVNKPPEMSDMASGDIHPKGHGHSPLLRSSSNSGNGPYVTSFRGIGLTQNDVDSLSKMDDGQIADWLIRNGAVK